MTRSEYNEICEQEMERQHSKQMARESAILTVNRGFMRTGKTTEDKAIERAKMVLGVA